MNVLDVSLWELFEKGGWVMWPLLVCSIVGLAVFVDRALTLARASLPFDRFIEGLRPLVLQQRITQALEHCRRMNKPVARLASCYLEHRHASERIRSVVLKREGSLILERLERRLRGLALVAHLSPLLGLLGTVSGLVSAFHQIELMGGQVQPDHLAAGIWEALLTTVVGLSIAIPATAAYHLLERRADAIARQMQFVVAFLDEWCGRMTTMTAQDTPSPHHEAASGIHAAGEE